MRALLLAVGASLTLTSGGAWAQVDAVAPPGGGSNAVAVHVDLAGARVLHAACAQAPCAIGDGAASTPMGVDRALLPTPGAVTTRAILLSGGRRVVHVKVPLLGASGAGAPAWEGVFTGAAEPLFAGVTGYRSGEPGERSGVALLWLGEGDDKTLAQGDLREDLRICGDDATLLSPRGLDPATLAWRGASLQRLSSSRREEATRLVASARGGSPADPPLAPLLVAQGASTAIGAPKALSDGDPETTWSEARPGAGAGEFVLFRAPHEVPLVRFAIAVAPRAPRPSGAAPRVLYLAADHALFEVTLPEDAWMHPGAAYDVPLPEPLATSCVALVLGEAYTHGAPRPEVTLAEVYAYSAFDAPGASLEVVARALSGGGPRAEAAAGVLKRAGAAGLDAAASVFASLDPAGRALAVDVAASSPTCASSSRLLAPALSDADEVVREKARAKLEEPHCGKDAAPALIAALGVDATRARASTVLASVAPRLALAPLAKALGRGSSRDRGVVRSAFAHAAALADPGDITALLDAPREPDVRVELLRAAEARLADARDAADRALETAFSASPDAAVRYALASPVAMLAHAGDARQDDRLLSLLSRDAEPYVRARAAELAGASARTQAGLDLAARDPEPRVREAALRTVAAARALAGQKAALASLTGDPWTFVRAEAAAALAALPPSADSEDALGHALADKAPRVRAAVIAALAGHGARALAGPVRARLGDRHEDPEVRVAAARALGVLCDAGAASELADHAVAGASSPDPDEVSLGLAATEALGMLHPPDLAKRLQAIHGKGARPDAQRAADAAVAGPGVCGAARPGR